MKVTWDVTFDKLSWAELLCVGRFFCWLIQPKVMQISERKLVFKSVAFLVDKDVWEKTWKSENCQHFSWSHEFPHSKWGGRQVWVLRKARQDFQGFIILVSRIKQTDPNWFGVAGFGWLGKQIRKCSALLIFILHTTHVSWGNLTDSVCGWVRINKDKSRVTWL